MSKKNIIEGILVRRQNDNSGLNMVLLEGNNQWGNMIEVPRLISDKLKEITRGKPYQFPDSGTYIKITLECSTTVSNIQLQDDDTE